MVQDIADNWVTLSQGSKFHAIFATSSVPEAITYYRLMKAQCPQLKITALFDPNISDEDGGGDPAFKTNGLVEILGDYNASFGHTFDLGSHANFKKDLAARLAHKVPYIRIETEPDKRLDLLIVVNQMLTGFDSKWVVALTNTHVTQANLNEFGRFDELKATVDQQKAKIFFEGLEGKELPLFRVNIRTAKHLQDFIIQGGL